MPVHNRVKCGLLRQKVEVIHKVGQVLAGVDWNDLVSLCFTRNFMTFASGVSLRLFRGLAGSWRLTWVGCWAWTTTWAWRSRSTRWSLVISARLLHRRLLEGWLRFGLVLHNCVGVVLDLLLDVVQIEHCLGLGPWRCDFLVRLVRDVLLI